MGELDAAEAAVRASVEGFQAIGEQFLVLESLGMLAGVAEARGDLEGAADAYEQLLEGSRVSGLANLVPLWLIRLGALRARQGDDATAEQLFAESVARSSTEPMRRAMASDRSGRCDTPSRRRRVRSHVARAGCGRVRVGPQRRWSRGRAHGLVLVGSRRRRPRRSRRLRRSGVPPGHRTTTRRCRPSAQTAAAAVAAVGSGSDADIERFAVARPSSAGAAPPDVSRSSWSARSVRRSTSPTSPPCAARWASSPSLAEPHPPTCLLQIARRLRLKQTERG